MQRKRRKSTKKRRGSTVMVKGYSYKRGGKTIRVKGHRRKR